MPLGIVSQRFNEGNLRPSRSLQRGACQIIETCKAALAVPKVLRPDVETATVSSAAEILSKLRAQEPGNRSLATVHIDDAETSWWALLDAMETVNQFFLEQLQEDSTECTWEELVRYSTKGHGRRSSTRSVSSAVDARR